MKATGKTTFGQARAMKDTPIMSILASLNKSKPWGKGVYKWSNGEVYDGEWYQGLKHGYGIWKGIMGDSYIGEWKNSRADGYGVHIWSNGDRYEGEWKQ